MATATNRERATAARGMATGLGWQDTKERGVIVAMGHVIGHGIVVGNISC
jgi:hypothetical protein